MSDEEQNDQGFGTTPEEYLGLVQAMDSLIAATMPIMQGLWDTYTKARECGFDEGQAFALTMMRAQIWFGGSSE